MLVYEFFPSASKYRQKVLSNICTVFKHSQFLDEFYHIEHLQSIDDTVDDLIAFCHKNGGQLQ